MQQGEVGAAGQGDQRYPVGPGRGRDLLSAAFTILTDSGDPTTVGLGLG